MLSDCKTLTEVDALQNQVIGYEELFVNRKTELKHA
jgi:hypothetical protein